MTAGWGRRRLDGDSFMSNNRNATQAGFTLVELLATIAIIGLIVALLLPAVQSARESARLSSCANNMKQMGMAVLQYESANGRFPSGRVGFNVPGGYNETPPGTSVSAQYQILPYLDEVNLFNSTNLGVMLSKFICPATTTPKSNEPRTCYFFSAGDARITDNQGFSGRGIVVAGSAGQFRHYFGPGGTSPKSDPTLFPTLRCDPYFRRAAQVKDGLSTSLMLAERAYGRSGRADDLRAGYAGGPLSWLNANYDRCAGLVVGGSYDPSMTLGSDIGDAWYSYLPGHSCFTTIFPPNGPSCGDSVRGYWGAGPTASSFHAARGVNTVFCDGAVRFVSELIDATCNRSSPHVGSFFIGNSTNMPSPYGVWGALGSINGGESAVPFD